MNPVHHPSLSQYPVVNGVGEARGALLRDGVKDNVRVTRVERAVELGINQNALAVLNAPNQNTGLGARSGKRLASTRNRKKKKIN